VKQSLFRKLTHRSLAKLMISGTILDVGGDYRSLYRICLGGQHKFITLNIDEQTKPDLKFNAESIPWPVSDSQFDAVLLINVLEHIYNYRAVLQESFRVVKPDGHLIIVVPFLYPLHPSPHDYFRYSEETLLKLLNDHHFSDRQLTCLGYGAFSTACANLQRFLPLPLYWFLEKISIGTDWVIKYLARRLGRKYTGAEYPLGYLVVARRSKQPIC